MVDVCTLGLDRCSNLLDRISTELAASLAARFGLQFAGREIPRVVEEPRPADLPRGNDWLLLVIGDEEARTLRLRRGGGFYFLKDVRPTDWAELRHPGSQV